MNTKKQDEEGVVEIVEQVTKAADELYNIRDTYFPLNPDDKLSKLKSASNLALNLLDSIPPEQRKTPMQRAIHEYLRGKLLNVFIDYRKEAEDHLSKFVAIYRHTRRLVKLNPSLADAWLCLGDCIWKKGDLASAKNCFNLALSKGPNKRILSQLSMLERKMAQGVENEAEIVEESIKHAKEAIALDVKDGNSWYNLGNACLVSFFVTGAWDHSKLLQSLKAYQNAEKDEKMHSNPDLYFNCATVHKYLENYERALSGFEAAALKDPCLNATDEVRKLVTVLDKLDNLLRHIQQKVLQMLRIAVSISIFQGQTKAKRLASLSSSLSTVTLNPSYRRTSVNNLLNGLNRTVAVVAKVVFFIKHDNITPLYYMLCDSNQICFVLTVYAIRNDAIKEGDQVTLLEPNYSRVDFSWKEKHYQLKSVLVDFVEQVLVNGKSLSPDHAVRTSIYAQHKP